MDSSIARAPFTVIVPAYNEEAVIGRTLDHLLDGWKGETRPRIIVVCNGCHDRTADAARGFSQVEVVEIAAASKSAAINAGLAQTRDFPVLVVDADIRIGAQALDALAGVLRQDGVMAASPSARFDTDRSGAPVRAYYRVWSTLGYLDSGVGGSGVYGLSEAGARALGALPPVIGDDTYVRWFFPLEQQRRLPADQSEATIEVPRRMFNLLACEVRKQAGNRQLRALMTEPADDKTRADAGRAPALSDAVIYYAVKLIGRLRLIKARVTGAAFVWGRDISSREASDRKM